MRPELFIDLHVNLQQNPRLIKQMLQVPGKYLDIDMLLAVPMSYLKDPVMLGGLADYGILEGMLILEEFDSLQDIVDLLYDDYEWVNARIRARPTEWNSCSPRFKQDHRLLLLAVKLAKRNYPIHSEWVKHSTRVRPPRDTFYGLRLSPLHETLYKNKQVLDVAAREGFLYATPDGVVPRSMIAKEIARFGLEHYPQYSSDFEMACAALYSDPGQILYVSWELIARCREEGYAWGNIRRLAMWWDKEETAWTADMLIRGVPNWRTISKNRALAMISQDASYYTNPPSSLTTENEFIKAALLTNGNVFGYLSPKRMNEKEFQLLIRYH